MTPAEPEPEAPARGTSESPGRLIAVAREAHSLGPADLAARLRLDTKVVKAIERDDFENLPAPMFVKGYIRSIAKELDLDADKILAAYASHASLDPPGLADFSSRAPDQIGINSTVIKAVTYGLVALLIVMIALWWRATPPSGTEHSPSAADSESVSAAVPLPYSFDVVEHDDTNWRSPPPPVAPPEATVPPATGADEDALAAADAGATHTLEIVTSSEAWVEVYDAAGARLFFGMARSGKPVTLEGYEYYRLVLGNTDSVRLVFDGEAMDLSAHAREGVAQLELGQSAPTPRTTESP